MITYAFIDIQNVFVALNSLGWKLDLFRFHRYLQDKYGVSRAYLFLGHLPHKQALYDLMRRAGFVLVFKPTTQSPHGFIKGNCDAELVLQAMIDYTTYDRAIIVSGDGDFYCLIRYLFQNNKLGYILIPNERAYSRLLKPFGSHKIHFLNRIPDKIGHI